MLCCCKPNFKSFLCGRCSEPDRQLPPSRSAKYQLDCSLSLSSSSSAPTSSPSYQNLDNGDKFMNGDTHMAMAMVDDHLDHNQASASLPSVSIHAHAHAPPSPVTSGESSSGITGARSSRYGSISTMATSLIAVDEWTKRSSMRQSMDYDDEAEEPQVQLPVSQRPKGRYSLSDFIIHRTLGTGSFGRVHLGVLFEIE